jgi:hypothetical protein
VEQGWQDARWTLARVAAVIERRFGVAYTLRGVSYLLHRIGYSRQVPTRRAIERDPEAIATWHRRRWPSVRGHGAWICFQGEAGQVLRPPGGHDLGSA